MGIVDYIEKNYGDALTLPELERLHWMCVLDMLTDKEFAELCRRLGKELKRNQLKWTPPIDTADALEKELYEYVAYGIGPCKYYKYEFKWWVLVNKNTMQKPLFFSLRMIGYRAVFILQALERLGFTDELNRFLELDDRLSDLFMTNWNTPPPSAGDYQGYINQGWHLFCDIAVRNYPMDYSNYFKLWR